MMGLKMETLSGQAASVLGLAGNPDMESRCVDVAFDAGVSYFFFYNLSFQSMIAGLNRLCGEHRHDVFVATGTEDRNRDGMQKYFDSARKRVGTDYLDLFFAQYVSPNEPWDEVIGALDELQIWKAEGHIRYVGATVHNRELAQELLQCKKIDVLMHRYNMAHRRCEDNVLPMANTLGMPVVSFTNTRWGSLLKGHAGWEGVVPSAADCYRYVLHNPAVRVALTAPASLQELEENLSVLPYEGIGKEKIEEWQAYGDLIYGDGLDAFETKWP